MTMLESVCVVCEKCTRHIQLKVYREHREPGGNCKPADYEVQECFSITDLLQQPVTAPLTPIEQRVQTSLVRRSTCSEEKIIQMKTGGKVWFKKKHL